ncbi:hypothetical protein HOO54_11660 [Bacillus sp. WMMC1349]|uniref:hypothetical protein n=1 Tax=Bacillus sp. WMMC1349 TaxID=2736254 RepID=UPI001554F76B|nr:hypothetical protein [Bacillus sp. WMMC1349]NPC92867.1 hypothetical protein [Bacillus sp. WMMC1349]
MNHEEVKYIIRENERWDRCYVSFLKPNANQTAISVEMCVKKDEEINSEAVE